MRKSEEDFNVKKHAEYDVSELQDYVNNFSDEWLLDVSRQNRPNTPHKQTNTYNVYTSSIHWKNGEKFVTNKISHLDSRTRNQTLDYKGHLNVQCKDID